MNINQDAIYDKNKYELFYKTYYNEEQKKQIEEYIDKLDVVQIKAMKIAQEHLASSFDILKSSGFKHFCSDK